MEPPPPSPDRTPSSLSARKIVRRERPSGWLFSEDRLPRNRRERRARYLSRKKSTLLERQKRRAQERDRRELRALLFVIAPIALLATVYVALVGSPLVIPLILLALLAAFYGLPYLERTIRRWHRPEK